MNTIIYVFDSLRPDWIGCYGGDANTPNINNLAKRGVCFQNAYAQGIYTAPSSASIFTGTYPETCRVRNFQRNLAPELPRLTDGLTEAGVNTACISTATAVSEPRGYDKGFSEFYTVGDGDIALSPDVMERLNDRALSWLTENADGEFLLVVWAMGTHHPYQTPETVTDDVEVEGTQEVMRTAPATKAAAVKKRYTETVEYSDRMFGEFIDALREENIYDETNILLTSDHGEVFDEHARLEQVNSFLKRVGSAVLPDKRRRYFGLFSPSAFVGHQGILPYEQLLRVPLIYKPAVARNTDTNKTIEAPIELVDIAPTVQSVYRGTVPDTMQGRSLEETITTPDEERVVFSSSKLTKGNTLYKTVQNRTHKLCLREYSWPGTFDKRTLKEAGSYYLSPMRVVLTTDGEERVSDTLVESKLWSLRKRHESRCRSVREEISESLTHRDIDRDVEAQLEELGYK